MMKVPVPFRARRVARRTALAYLVLAALWILLSDHAVTLVTSDPSTVERLSLVKGWAFVGVTAALLYYALRKQLVRLETEAEARQRASDALRDAEERQRLFVEHAPAALAMFDREMRYLAVSRRWLADYQLAGRDVVGLSHYEVFPEITEQLKAIHRRGLAGEVVSAKADPFTRKDGAVRWLRWEMRPWRDARGEVGGIVIFSEDITERITTEGALRASEERFRSVVESSPVAIFLQAEGKFAYLNPAAVALFGAKAPEALVGQMVLDRFHLADQQQVLARIRMVNEERRAVPLAEEHLLRCDGTVAEAEVAAVPFRVGETDGALVFARDITEEKRAREQLRLHEAVLRETGTIAKVGGWSFDPTTGEGFWTEEVARIHDCDPAGRASMAQGLEFYRGESRARIEAAVKAAVEQGTPYDLQLELVTAAGAHKWVRTIGHPVVETGKVVRVRGSFQDVTELYEATAALRESEARFRELAETINEVFWITDPGKTRMLYVSPAYERIWGATCAHLYAAPLSWLEAVHPEDRDRVAAAAATKQATGEYNETYRIVRPDGGLRWVQDQAFPVRDADGRVVRIVGVAEDITEKKRIETQFLRAQRTEAVGALAGGVAHDLNNILTPVLMAAGVLKGEAAEANNLELISMIEQSARRGADIIRQLLTFSRGVEGERIVLQPRHLIREMAAIVRETFPREIELLVDVAADLWNVEANSTQLHQVLLNLCVNARDAMPAGGRLMIEARNCQLAPEGRELVGELKPGPHVLITVADTGCGMAPEVLERIFEPFFTTKEPGKGTGLGLSTVLGIVRSHGGHVGVASEPGRGSRFKVYLPARPAGDSAAVAAAAAPASGRGELVLVVDDEGTIREMARHVLEKGGYRVLVARNGEEALSLALQHAGALRVVLTDMMMPIMDGLALTRALHSIDLGIVVIATSGMDQETKRPDLAALGVYDFLPKPCAATEMLATVRRALDERGPDSVRSG